MGCAGTVLFGYSADNNGACVRACLACVRVVLPGRGTPRAIIYDLQGSLGIKERIYEEDELDTSAWDGRE